MSLVPLWMHPLDPALYTLRAQVLQLYADPRLTHGRGRGTRAPWLYRTVPRLDIYKELYGKSWELILLKHLTNCNRFTSICVDLH